MSFRYKLMQFMSGRYGIDTLFYVILSTAMALSLVNCFVRSNVLQIIVYLLMFVAFFRFFSRNITARAEENRRATAVIRKAKNTYNIYRQRKADTTHIYKKCPSCRAVLRLPRRKGKHKTVCPRCSKEFSVRVYKG